MLVTCQPRAVAALHIRLPKNPLPPQTTSFVFAAVEADIVGLDVIEDEMDNSSFKRSTLNESLGRALHHRVRLGSGEPPSSRGRTTNTSKNSSCHLKMLPYTF